MQIQINTDHHIEGHEALAEWARGEVKTALKLHTAHITRVELHLSGDNGGKPGHKGGPGDKRCLLEVRLQGRQPLAVTHHADTLYQAVTGAAAKMNHLIDSTLGRAARMAPVPEPETDNPA